LKDASVLSCHPQNAIDNGDLRAMEKDLKMTIEKAKVDEIIQILHHKECLMILDNVEELLRRDGN